MDTILQDLGEVLGSYDYSGLDPEITGLAAATFALIITLGIFLVLIIINYIYTSLTLYKIAQKLNVDKPWLAWIPIVKVYLLLVLGDMNPYFMLLFISPFILGLLSAIPDIGVLFSFLLFFNSIGVMVVTVISYMKISEKIGYDKLLGLLTLYPLTSYILMGILAWGKKGPEN